MCHFPGLLFSVGSLLLPVIPISWNNVMCTGAENTLTECSHSQISGAHSCSHGDDAIVQCLSSKLHCYESLILLLNPIAAIIIIIMEILFSVHVPIIIRNMFT